MEPTDQELAARIGRRDAEAFEVLCARYREPLLRHLANMVRDADAADDLLQEVLLRVWTHIGQWDGRGALKAWLFRSATNRALNYKRALSRRRQRPLEIPPDSASEEDDALMPAWMIDTGLPGPEAAYERAERYALFRRLVHELPASKREVLRLVYDAELEIREVAKRLGIPEGTVKSRLHYATRRLAQAWDELSAEEAG
jgi:RNA polymerase sigma-70 factor (ECF subfamily)